MTCLLCLRTEQAECMHASRCVSDNLIIEAVRTPCVGEEHNAHRPSKVIQLQTTAANSIHNRRVVHNLVRHLD